jgi:two-component system, chemotaxis family, protein-glutamate methylesterase/glutaminase
VPVSTPDGVLAIGGSAGSVEALVQLVAALPPDLPAPVLVTVHIGSDSHSNLPRILSRAGPLPAAHARHGEPLRPGRIHVAPPNFHLLAAAGTARLSSGPRVNRHRPAVDVMFASAARWARERLMAVVLSGVLDDGAVGSALVEWAGGRVMVQDPADALFDSMPRAALAAVPTALAAPASRLGTTIGQAFADLGVGANHGAVNHQRRSGQEMNEPSMADSGDPGFLSADEVRLTRMSCPECNGGLAEMDLTGVRYYRCHVGHQFSPLSLEAAQREAVEAKLWAAAAALEEHAALARHLARAEQALGPDAAEGYRRAADRSADTARSLVSKMHDSESTASAAGADGRVRPAE